MDMIAGTGNMAESIEYNRAILPVLAAKIPSKLGVRRDTFSAPPELWSSTNQPEIFLNYSIRIRIRKPDE
jgi:hypothetical protein